MATEERQSIRLRIIQINDVYSLKNFPSFNTLVLQHTNATEQIDSSIRASLPPSPAAADATIVVLAGDFLAPYLLSSLDKGRGMVDVMNASGVTHVCFGNHEADVPSAALKERMEQSKFQWLNTNMRELDDKIGCSTPPYDVLQVGSGATKVRIVLLGLLTEDPGLYRKGVFEDSKIEPVLECTTSTLKHLEETYAAEGGVDLVVPITHQDIDIDRQFAEHFTGKVFPIVVGGHDHDIHQVVTPCGSHIVKTGMNAEHTAVIDVVWDDIATKDSPKVSVEMIPTSKFPPSPNVERLVRGHELILDQFDKAKLFRLRAPPRTVSKIVGADVPCDGTAIPDTTKADKEDIAHTAEPFSTFANRRYPSTGSTVLTSIIRMGMRAQCAIMNAGNIRGGRVYNDPEKEWFTWSDLKTEIPYWNGITTVTLPGKVLQETIAYSRRGAYADPPVENGAYVHTCDMIRYDDETRTIKTIRGKPFAPDSLYLTALPLVMLQGIDNHKPILDWWAVHGDSRPLAEESGRPAKLVVVEFFAALLWLDLGDFASIDTNQDGLLSKEEINAKAQEVFGREFADLVVSNVLAVADIDGNGYVSADEMIVTQFVATDMMYHVCSRKEQDVLRRLAGRVMGRRASDAVVQASVDNLLQMMDQNGDGKIGREEAIATLGELASKGYLC